MFVRKDLPPQRVHWPFAQGQWRMSLGLKALDLREWIEIDAEFGQYLQQKRVLLRDRPQSVLAALPHTVAAQQELLDMLTHHLTTRFPQWFQLEGDRICNQLTGETWCSSDFAEAPIDLAGRLVQEDLCLMMPSKAGYWLGAASLCFPLYWQLQEKLGRVMGAIHEPVPGYESSLHNPVTQYFDRLTPEHSGYRLNWSIVDTPELFLGLHRTHAVADDITSENAGDRLWVRVERQTLRRLPITEAIVFTVRSFVYPLWQVHAQPQAAQGLDRTIAQLTPEMRQYKSIEPIRSAIAAYLRTP
ncbi:heme-dependent oxidative N-demethylase family protein [Leptolyngbya sp. AN02str]|uniref:heme-dependent oxidative N-demethylase family protein n=1 Tax=Leptolyngbya sp. AN02str TaxID=3423363 RepID=UPI003D312FFD